MGELWLPGAAGPQDRFVDAVHRQIAAYAERVGAPQACVEVELADGSRFALDALEPEPGFGFVTLRLHPGDDDAPDELVVPVGAVRRLELRRAEEAEGRFGFQLPG